MANTIRIKRRPSSGSAGAPSSASLYNGELAFNENDNTLYYAYGSGVGGISTAVPAIAGSGAYALRGGTNATGTWPISIGGTAAYATNAVYTTGNQTVNGDKTLKGILTVEDTIRIIGSGGGGGAYLQMDTDSNSVGLFTSRYRSNPINMWYDKDIGIENGTIGDVKLDAMFGRVALVGTSGVLISDDGSGYGVTVSAATTSSSGTHFAAFTSYSDGGGVIKARTAAQVKGDIGLSNVTNDIQVKQTTGGTTAGYLPTWNSTSGELLAAGYAVSTNLVTNSGSTHIPRADSVVNYVSSGLANHVHGNITNDGKVGSTANLPLITTTAGSVTTGSFGTTANTFCQGNDSRLSGIVYTTGTQNINGSKTFGNALNVIATGSVNPIATVNIGGLNPQSNVVPGRLTIAKDDGDIGKIQLGTPYANADAVAMFTSVPIKLANYSDANVTFVISPTGYYDSNISDYTGAVTSGYWRASTIQADKGGTGQTSYSNGQLLIGSGTSLAANTLTQGSNVQITNGSGTITIAATGLALSSRTLTAGSGLVGGGDLSSDKTFNIGQGDGISVSADAIAVNSTVVRTIGNQIINGFKSFYSNAEFGIGYQTVFTIGDSIGPGASGAGLMDGTTPLATEYWSGSESIIHYAYGGGTLASPRIAVLESNGYVGIGTSSPNRQLHVVGTGLFTGGIISSGTNSIQAASTASTATQFAVFTSSPNSSTQTVFTRTPSEVKTDIGLSNVTNNIQVKQTTGGTTVGYVPTWNSTSGELLAAGYSIETTLTGGTSSLPRADAVKTYVDSMIGSGIATNDAMIFKGIIDCSTNPNYPAADRGWTYKVSVAGKIGGASGPVVEVNDTIICGTDGTAAGTHGSVGSNWNILQTNIADSSILVTGPASATSGNIAMFNGSTGKIINDGGFLISDIARLSNSQTFTGINTFGVITAGYQVGSDPAFTIYNDGDDITFRVLSGGSITAGTWNATTIAADKGGTGQSSYTIGDLLYANTTTTLAKLADVATGNVLLAGGVSTAPSWGKVGLTTHVSGTLPVANGGTNQTSYTNGQLLIGNSTGNTLTKATLTQGTAIDITNGTGSITIGHNDTSTLSGAQGSNGIASFTVDGMGHVTAVTTATYLTAGTVCAAIVDCTLDGGTF